MKYIDENAVTDLLEIGYKDASSWPGFPIQAATTFLKKQVASGVSKENLASLLVREIELAIKQKRLRLFQVPHYVYVDPTTLRILVRLDGY